MYSFNSRARKGRDEKLIAQRTAYKLFQFTRPQGARRGLTLSWIMCPSFNSRARKGRDIAKRQLRRLSEFQFTRPQGARRDRLEEWRNQERFQFTRPQGARL